MIEAWFNFCDYVRWLLTRHRSAGKSTEQILLEVRDKLQQMPAGKEVHAALLHIDKATAAAPQEKPE